MKMLSAVLVFSLFLSANLYAADSNDVIVKEVVGQGSNRNEAIKNALYIAVSQVRGVKVDSGKYELGFSEAGVGIDSQQAGKKRIEFDAVSVEASGTAYTTEIAGLVKTYEILEEKKIDDNTYEVKLRAMVYSYAARGDVKRTKIALMPVKALAPSYSFWNLQTPAAVLSNLFVQRLAVALTQTNKFAVLDRENLIDFAREKQMLLSDNTPLEEQAKLAATLGADFLLVGTISEAKIERTDKFLQATGSTITEYKSRFVFNYRLIISSSKQVVFAGIAERYLENEELRALSNEWDPKEWDPAQIRDGVITLVANDVVKTIIDRLYPIKVAAIQENGTVILNQGGEKIAVGTLLNVFTEGQEIFDTDTKESLGKVENLVATIRINRIEPKMSFAQVVTGEASKITKGLTCRIKQTTKKDTTGRKPDIGRTKQGGVKLPFDN
jgi:hypothetical protein